MTAPLVFANQRDGARDAQAEGGAESDREVWFRTLPSAPWRRALGGLSERDALLAAHAITVAFTDLGFLNIECTLRSLHAP